MSRTGISELNAVVAVASHRNFRAAAIELDMSPSALSHAIAALEKRMSVRLFNRTTRSVSLSAAGEEFLDRVAPALREISAAMEAANTHSAVARGTLRINTSEGAARRIIEPLVLPFLARYREMKIDLVTEGRFVDIVAEGFDAGIRLTEAVPQDMVAVPIGRPHHFAVVATQSYLDAAGVPSVPGDLARHNCIRRRMHGWPAYRWEFERHGEKLDVDVQGSLTLNSDDIMLAAARAGAGLAYLSEWPVAPSLADGSLVQVLTDWMPPGATVSLYYPRHRHMTAGLRALIDMIRENKARLS